MNRWLDRKKMHCFNVGGSLERLQTVMFFVITMVNQNVTVNTAALGRVFFQDRQFIEL